MIYTGIIYRYDEEEQTGQVMVGDGETKSFTKSEWVEQTVEPSVGQKISYEVVNNQVRIQLETQEKKSPNCSMGFTNVEDAIAHYKGLGFKLAKDTQTDMTRTISFRYYSSDTGDFAEAIVKQIGESIHITQTLNGQTVTIS
jgi:hypothetical protein